MEKVLQFKSRIEECLKSFCQEHHGKIYDPVDYILQLGGKRLRPCLLMAVAEALGADTKASLPLAASVEMFHNFTLLHDDIMDEAATRRGEQTVHMKWSRDQAILSGDIMFAMSYDLLMRSDGVDLKKAHSLFTTTAKEVCIGQQMDMDFESRDDVSQEEYLEMIRLKTSVLIGASTALGGIAASAADKEVEALYDFGQYMGISFQIQDDILDAYGETAAVGKRIGGDILQNKKTLLFLKAMELGDEAEVAELKKWYAMAVDSQEKVQAVKNIIRSSGALEATQETQRLYLNRAMDDLDRSSIEGVWSGQLKELAMHQLERTF